MARRLLHTIACATALSPPAAPLRQPTRRPATLEKSPATTTVSVDLGDRSYPIYIGDGLLTEDAATASQYLQTHVKGSQVLIVTNEILDRLGYTQRTKAALEYGDSGLRVETLVLPDNENEPSEATKTLENLGRITDYAIEKALDRKATFVALGGGVIGDMVGFAAACYVRGVDFIQIPTTLMAMVDSSVGGKTAVNSKSAKNMVGAFYQPVAVVADVGSLRTLPDRELASGVSEVIKYGLIRDAPFFEWLEDNIEKVLERDSEALIETVEASCRNKAEVVALDEKEGGVRATLNLGHTFGHAIETKAGYGTYLHGEAVGIGMHMAAKMSRDLGWISDELFERAVALVARAKVPIVLPLDSPLDVASFESIMAVDKKVADGLLRLILLKGDLGNCVFTGEYDRTVLKETLEHFCDPENRSN
jgi:3-dehydroquinate synthase